MAAGNHLNGTEPGSPSRSEEQAGESPEALASGATGTLQATPSFMDRLSEGDRHALRSRARQESYAAGAVICREGAPGDAVYVVQSGQVAVLKETSDGRFTLLANRGPGEILGEMSLVGKQPRSASLVAVERTQVLRIEAADFPRLMNSHPGVSWAVLNALNDRLHAADEARTTIVQEEKDLARRLRRLTNETERLVELARVRQETLELIAHDLRTPVAVIQGCLQMLHAQLPQDALRSTGQVLHLAERSSRRLMSLLDELLAAARQEDPSLSLPRQPVDLARLVRSTLDSVRAMAGQARISLTHSLPPDLPQPLGDTNQLERALINLLDNALTYTPDGGRVVVSAVTGEDEVRVSVTDNGPGVPAEHREQIFERFTRVRGVQGRRRGFGLGLHFCRQVVRAHGGRIWVEPGPGDVGSRFVFTLPLGNGTDDV
jgi:signal transduction histidine kinase